MNLVREILEIRLRPLREGRSGVGIDALRQFLAEVRQQGIDVILPDGPWWDHVRRAAAPLLTDLTEPTLVGFAAVPGEPRRFRFGAPPTAALDAPAPAE